MNKTLKRLKAHLVEYNVHLEKKRQRRRETLQRICQGPDAIAASKQLARLSTANPELFEPFETKVKPIVAAYNSVYKCSHAFGEVQDPSTHTKRKRLITRFINALLSTFSIIQVQTVSSLWFHASNITCASCGKEITFGEACRHCGHIHDIIDNSPSYRELDKSSNANSPYDRRVNFHESVMSFLGKQTNKPSKDVYKAITQYANRFHIDPSELGKDTIKFFLRISKHSNNYKDVNLIHHNLTGKPLPKVDDEIIERVIKRHEAIIPAFDKVKGNRKNFLHAPYTYNQLLGSEGIKVDPDDFTVLKTDEVIRKHRHIMSRAYKELKKNNSSFSWEYRSFY
jgi:hypothetical protein